MPNRKEYIECERIDGYKSMVIYTGNGVRSLRYNSREDI